MPHTYPAISITRTSRGSVIRSLVLNRRDAENKLRLLSSPRILSVVFEVPK